MVLAHLRFYSQRERPPFLGLSALAAALGIEYRRPSLVDTQEGWAAAWDEVRDLVSHATAFLITDAVVLEDQVCVEQLHARIAEGGRAILQPDINGLDAFNRFLQRYGLRATGTQVMSNAVDPSVVAIHRSPATFRDAALLGGVDDVVIRHPYVVWYEREAVPILVATDAEWLLDQRTDLPAGWNARELACIAGWRGPREGGVIVLGAGIFTDLFQRWNGSTLPGIERNAVLASNLLSYVARHPTACSPAELAPEDHCRRAEVNLVDFVLAVLRDLGEDWWIEGVPLKVRQSCASRQEEEARRRFGKEAYLDLIDLKDIIEKQWRLFEPHFKAVGQVGGKDKSLQWLVRFNELRRMVAHPLKRHVAGHVFTSDEIAFLRECDSRALALVRSIQKPQ